SAYVVRRNNTGPATRVNGHEEDGRGVEEAAGPSTVPGLEEEGDRTSLHGKISPQQGEGNLRLRGLRSRTILTRHKVRFWVWLAQLLDRTGQRQHRGSSRPDARNGTGRDSMQELRQPPRPRLRRRSPADWNAILRKFSISRLHEERYR